MDWIFNIVQIAWFFALIILPFLIISAIVEVLFSKPNKLTYKLFKYELRRYFFYYELKSKNLQNSNLNLKKDENTVLPSYSDILNIFRRRIILTTLAVALISYGLWVRHTSYRKEVIYYVYYPEYYIYISEIISHAFLLGVIIYISNYYIK
jgi:hypothetical protein